MPLTLTLELPGEIERRIRETTPDVPAYAREALAIQLFREDKISHYELGQMLGIDRFETDALLMRYKVPNNFITSADIDREVAGLNELLGPPR